MTRITTLICSAILATATASPVLAGGKTVAGAPTTVPPAVRVAGGRARPDAIRGVPGRDAVTSYEISRLLASFM